MVIFVTTINKTGLESGLENMEENKVLVKELPYPFDEDENRLLEQGGSKCIMDYRGDGRPVLDHGQIALSYDGCWWQK